MGFGDLLYFQLQEALTLILFDFKVYTLLHGRLISQGGQSHKTYLSHL